VARELAGQGAVVLVNTDDNPDLARRFAITGIPVLLILRGGKVLDRESGAMGRSALLAWWKRYAA